MSTFRTRVALLLFVSLAALATSARAQEQNQGKPADKAIALKQYNAIKKGLARNKQEMCSFLLADIDNENELLDLAKVTYLFESALDHLAKSSEYVSLMRPHVDQKVIANFDHQGGNYVLEVSEARRRVIEEYEQAEKSGASELKKRDLLEQYFNKACEFKLSTIVAEKAMYESALRAEESLRIKLFPDEH